MLDPVFSLIALVVLIVTSVMVYRGHQIKYKDVIIRGDIDEIRKFALDCCNAHRYHLLVMAAGMAIMVLFSMPLGMILSAVGLFLVELKGIGWFLKKLINF